VISRAIATVAVLTVALVLCVTLVIRLSRALLVPAIVGGGLYLAVRLVNAYLGRW